MSLRKSPTMTPARLAANRRSALLSTGPRTKRGKARSGLNGLRTGTRSESCFRLLDGLIGVGPGAVHETAAGILTPEELTHPFFASFVECFQHIQEFALEHMPAYQKAKAEVRRRTRERPRKKFQPTEA